ncbi:MAG: hypothetical protein ACREVQ_11940 [Burkholderiales bacterium]
MATALGQTADTLRGVDQLRQRMNPTVTQKPPSVGPLPSVQAPKASGWSKLAVGLERNEVQSLLGTPDRIETQGQSARWHWEHGAEQGWVEFAGEPPKVREWRSR